MQRDQPIFIFNSMSFPVPLNFAVFGSINNNISICIYREHMYNVRSNVSLEVFQSFINYLFQINTNIPSITAENIEQYYLLNEEFESLAISNLIDEQRRTFNEFVANLTNLRNQSIQNKARIEQSIASNLDEYVTHYGEELISSPIESLLRIFYNNDRIFTQHNRLYELINSQYQRTNDLNIFAILPTLQLNQLTRENQRDSIQQQESRAGMIPKPNLLSMMDKIEEQRRELKRLKINYTKIAKIFIRSHAIKVKDYSEENETKLLEAFEHGDVKRVKSILTVEVQENNLKYKLNLLDFTAEVVSLCDEIQTDELIIPKSIQYNNTEYIITKIEENAISYANFQHIFFPEDSQVHFISKNAFHSTKFQTLTLPPLLENFSLSWTYTKDDFGNIKLHPNSRNFSMINNQVLIGKSDNSNNFDVIYYANIDTTEVNIPDCVKKIFEYAFVNCNRLTKLNFSRSSQLQIICEKAFANTPIQAITIPSRVTKICKSAFKNCIQLRNINFSENSQLQIICEKAFSNTSIQAITIPSHVNQIDSFAFKNCLNLRLIRFAPNSELRSFNDDIFSGCFIDNLTIPGNVEKLKKGWYYGLNESCNISISPDNHNFMLLNEKILLGKTNNNSNQYDILLFARRDVEEENIPDYIRFIGPFALSNCTRLKTIHFSENSQLNVIDNYAFNYSSMQDITIPSHVQRIGELAFDNCLNLRTVDFKPNSELRLFNSNIFSGSSIKNLTIPSNVEKLEKGWYYGLNESCNISISPDNHNFMLLNEKILLGKTNNSSNQYDILLFARRDVEEENIPDYIRFIGPFAFSNCTRLKTIHFSENSQLNMIDINAFSESSIISIRIPQKVTIIGDYAFNECRSLSSCEFAPNSELHIISKYAFKSSHLKTIKIPQHVTEIGNNAFNLCKNLYSVQFTPNSELQIIGSAAFMSSSISTISIPAHVTQIRENAFSDCKLQTLIFTEDSELQNIDANAFYSTTVRNSTIPSHLTSIIHFH